MTIDTPIEYNIIFDPKEIESFKNTISALESIIKEMDRLDCIILEDEGFEFSLTQIEEVYDFLCDFTDNIPKKIL